MGRRKKSTTKSKGRTKSGKKQTKLKIPGPKGSSTAENLVQLMLLGSDLIEKHTRKKAAQEAKTNANPPRKNLSFRPPRVLTKSKDLFFHLCSLLVFVLVRSFCPLFHLHSLTFSSYLFSWETNKTGVVTTFSDGSGSFTPHKQAKPVRKKTFGPRVGMIFPPTTSACSSTNDNGNKAQGFQDLKVLNPVAQIREKNSQGFVDNSGYAMSSRDKIDKATETLVDSKHSHFTTVHPDKAILDGVTFLQRTFSVYFPSLQKHGHGHTPTTLFHSFLPYVRIICFQQNKISVKKFTDINMSQFFTPYGDP